MKVAPVSGDLLLKLGAGLAVAGLAWHALGQARRAAGDAAGAVADAASAAADAVGGALGTVVQAVNPTNSGNVFYGGVNAVGGALSTDPAGPGMNADGSWTLGGFIYDLTHGPAFTPTAPPPLMYGATSDGRNADGATGAW